MFYFRIPVASHCVPCRHTLEPAACSEYAEHVHRVYLEILGLYTCSIGPLCTPYIAL